MKSSPDYKYPKQSNGRTSPIYEGEIIAPVEKVTKKKTTKKTTKKKTTKKEESYGTKGHDAETGNI